MFQKGLFWKSLPHKIIIHGPRQLKIMYPFFLQNFSCQDRLCFEFDCQKFKMTIKTFKKLLLNIHCNTQAVKYNLISNLASKLIKKF